jgi:hypothetical protein
MKKQLTPWPSKSKGGVVTQGKTVAVAGLNDYSSSSYVESNDSLHRNRHNRSMRYRLGESLGMYGRRHQTP